MNQPTVVSRYKRYMQSFLLAFCLLQATSYASVSQDISEAREMPAWGNAASQLSLGRRYRLGNGVEQDFKEALA